MAPAKLSTLHQGWYRIKVFPSDAQSAAGGCLGEDESTKSYSWGKLEGGARGAGRALQTHGGKGQEGIQGGGIKEDQIRKDMRQTPAAGVTQRTCETAETWPKEPKMSREAKWKTKMKAGGAGLACSSPTNTQLDECAYKCHDHPEA